METFGTKLRQTKSLLEAAGIFCGHGFDSIHDEAVALLLSSVNLTPGQNLSILGEPFPEWAEERLAALIYARSHYRFPLAYVLGEAWLAGKRFLSDSRALVPRSPIAHLLAEGLAPWWIADEDPAVIVDVCSGGGSLGVLAAIAFPDAAVFLSDLDDAALQLARENIELHGLSTRSSCIQADLLSAMAPESIDVVLANPPYVPDEEMLDLPPEYLHEPRMALAAEDKGTQIACKLLAEATQVLTPRGLLVLEVGEAMAVIEQCLPKVPFIWVDLPQGGAGVTAISAQELRDWRGSGVL